MSCLRHELPLTSVLSLSVCRRRASGRNVFQLGFMFTLVTLFTFFALYLSFSLKSRGGYEIQITEAPYQVNYGDVCGGVLIHSLWVLTAAHCGIRTFIRVGSRFRLKNPEIPIHRHRIHPEHGKYHGFGYDLQLLKLYGPLRETMLVQPLRFSSSYGTVLKVSGWGYMKEKTDYSNVLNQVELNIVPKEDCQAYNISWYNNTLTEEMFCAGGASGDACQGDSGGAVVSEDGVIGISSFGYGCGRVSGVYINVSYPGILEWIRNFTGLDLNDSSSSSE